MWLIPKPAGNCITRKCDNTAAEFFNLRDERVIDAIQLPRQFFRAAPNAQRARVRFGERRKAGDVCKQNTAQRAVRQCFAARQRGATVLRQICF